MFQIITLQSGGIGNFVIIPLMFLVIYLFMIRPQMKRQKNEKKFQASIAKGNKIINGLKKIRNEIRKNKFIVRVVGCR